MDWPLSNVDKHDLCRGPEVGRRSVVRGRILTTHPKSGDRLWCERTVLLPGWLDEVERSRGQPGSLWRSLYWGWKLFRASGKFDAVVTGCERAVHVFALLQKLARRKKVPHVVLYVFFKLPDSGLKRALKRLYFRQLIEATSRIIVYSHRQIELYARMFRVSADKFVCVPYHTTLYGAEYLVSEGDYVFAGGDFTRDYATLIEAARGLPCRVVIAARYRHYFHGLHLPANVEILTATHDQFLGLMAGAGVVVVPLRGGLLQSGGQQTYLNAMLMGKAVIVADDCGADEYIAHGATGMIVRPGDSLALREAICSLMKNRHLARSMGESAKTSATEYSPEHFLRGVFAVVHECVEGKAYHE